jgi:hypothetical protein
MCNALVYGLNPVVQKAWREAHPAAYDFITSFFGGGGAVQDMQPVGSDEVEVSLQRGDVGFDGRVSGR